MKVQISPKGKSFVWTTIFNRINTNDVLQKHRPLNNSYPNMCAMCSSSLETMTTIFALFWHESSLEQGFKIFGGNWLP